VAAWLSETVLRGRGPGDSGFESHRRGKIFSKEGTSAGPHKEKKRKKQADRKVPDRPGEVKGERIQKKKQRITKK
jgi:hypothetical protein